MSTRISNANPLPRAGSLPDTHLVADLLAPGLRLVFCGTALGRVSAERRAYYANPTNFFWRTLHRVGLTPDLLKPEEFPKLLEYGIGLTDLCKTAYGNDAELPEQAFDVESLKEKLRRYQPGILAFTSKTGAAAFLGERVTARIAYGEQKTTLDKTRLFVLPSPSGQARTYWDESWWRRLAESLN